MAKTKDRKAGESCPNCGGAYIVDEKQNPETLIDRKLRNAVVPAVAQRFAHHVTEKVEDAGIIHRCIACGYRERFQPNSHAA